MIRYKERMKVNAKDVSIALLLSRLHKYSCDVAPTKVYDVVIKYVQSL